MKFRWLPLCVIVPLIVWPIFARAQSGMLPAGSGALRSTAYNYGRPPIDASGFSVIATVGTPCDGYNVTCAGSMILHASNTGVVSSCTTGNGSAANPFDTYAHAYTCALAANTRATVSGHLTGQGQPDQLLLDNCSTFTENPVNLALRGWTSVVPFVIGAYGACPSQRPTIQTTLTGFGSNGLADYIAFIGVKLYAYKRDPSNPSFSNVELASTPYGFDLFSSQWVLIEDCDVSFYYRPLNNNNFASQTDTMLLRRNILHDGWKDGNFVSAIHHYVLEQNLFANLTQTQYQSPQTLLITLGSPATFEWTGGIGNPIQDTTNSATSFIGIQNTNGTMPTGITSYLTTGTVYFVKNVGSCAGCGGNTNKFNLYTDFAGTSPVNLTTCSGGCSLTQGAAWPTTFTSLLSHQNYSQNDGFSPSGYTTFNEISQNLFCCGAGDAQGQFISGGTIDDNLFFKSAGGILVSKGSPVASNSPWTTRITNNVMVDGRPMTIFGYDISPFSWFPCSGQCSRAYGIITGATLGTVIVQNNIAAHAGQAAAGVVYSLNGGVSSNASIFSPSGLMAMAASGGVQDPRYTGIFEGAAVGLILASGTTLPTCTANCGTDTGSQLKTQANGTYYVKNLNIYGGPVFNSTSGAGSAALLLPTAVGISLANPAVITWSNHGLQVGQPIFFNTAGTLPSHIAAATNSTAFPAAPPQNGIPPRCDLGTKPVATGFNCYYVLSVLDANTFTIAATQGGTAIDTSADSQSGQASAASATTTSFNLSLTPGGAAITTSCAAACLTSLPAFGLKPTGVTVTGNVWCDWGNGSADIWTAASLNNISNNIKNDGTQTFTGSADNLNGIPTFPSGCDGAYPTGIAGHTSMWDLTPSHTVPFPHPNLTVATYDCDVMGNCPTSCPGISLSGNCGTESHFLTLALAQSKGNWDPRLMAHAVNEYIRAGFGLTYQ